MSLGLTTNEVHLWFASAADFSLPDLAEQHLSWLSEAEQQQFQRYHFDRHRLQMLLSRILMRKVLSQYLDLAPEELEFDSGPHGKPSLVIGLDLQPLHFNLSHSSGQVVLAVTRHEETGIDIEDCRKIRRVEGLARRNFTEAEFANVCSGDAENGLQAFYKIWTLKEAYIKARGFGLILPLQEFEFSFPARNQIAVEFLASLEDRSGSWQFWHTRMDAAFHLALGIKSGAKDAISRLVAWRMSALDQFSRERLEFTASQGALLHSKSSE